MNYKVIKIKEYIGYQEALKLQMKVFDSVLNKVYDGVLLILEHNPVLTMGIRTDTSNLLVSEEYLHTKGVELFTTDRGGDITFHGPGQIVAYPIVRIKDLNLRLSDYMHKLEDVVIATLNQYNIDAYRKEEFPGVWVEDTKICAIGVHAKKFIVYHGFAFNVEVDKDYFNLINPCGITEYKVSSMNDFINRVDIETVKDTIIKQFNQVFNVSFEEMELSTLKEHL